jgi:hypothetical protein
LTAASRVLVYATSERLSLCSLTYDATMPSATVLHKVVCPKRTISRNRRPLWGCPSILTSLSSLSCLPGESLSNTHKYNLPFPLCTGSFCTQAHIPTYSATKPHCLPHPLTKTNYHHTQWLPTTLPQTFSNSTPVCFLHTSPKATRPMLRHAAMATSLALAMIGLAESRDMPSTKTTASLSRRLREAVHLRLGEPHPARRHAPPPTQTKVRVRAPSSHSSCHPQLTPRGHAKSRTCHSASSHRATTRSSAPTTSITSAGCQAAFVSQSFAPTL